MPFPAFFRDPLIHFLLAGAMIFAALSALRPPERDDRIIVDREGLLTFIQYRARAFEPEAAARLLDTMPADDRARLIEDFVREEALFREASRLGLDAGDYVIRRRMVQKLEFMTDASLAPRAVSDDALSAYFEENRANYTTPAGATFTHVFLSREGRSQAALREEAIEMLVRLRAEEAGYSDAPRYGERFLFHTNYVERTDDFVESHFGPAATASIFSEETPLETWTGPLLSEHGAHIVFIAARSPARTPDLEEIRERVERDAEADERGRLQEALIDAIVGDYAVEKRVEAVGEEAARPAP